MDQKKEQKRDNSGYLYPNKDKRTDKQPDYRGKVNIGGKDWLFSGWKRMKDGDEMISVSLTDPSTLPARDPSQQNKQPSSGPFAKTQSPQAQATGSKSFQPNQGKAASADYDDLEDLDSLFNGLDDK